MFWRGSTTGKPILSVASMKEMKRIELASSGHKKKMILEILKKNLKES